MSVSKQQELDARRYRWLRDRLAIEDIDRLESEFFGTPSEAESVRADEAVDRHIVVLNSQK